MFKRKMRKRHKRILIAVAATTGVLLVIGLIVFLVMKKSGSPANIEVSMVPTPNQTAAVAAEPQPAEAPTENVTQIPLNQDKIDAFFESGLSDFSIHSENLIEALTEKFGSPNVCTIEKRQNGHAANAPFAIHHFVYDGLTIDILKRMDNAEFLVNMTLSSPQYPLRDGLAIGASLDTVKTLFGDVPKIIKGNEIELAYPVSDSENKLRFYFRNHKLYQLSWEPYFD